MKTLAIIALSILPLFAHAKKSSQEVPRDRNTKLLLELLESTKNCKAESDKGLKVIKDTEQAMAETTEKDDKQLLQNILDLLNLEQESFDVRCGMYMTAFQYLSLVPVNYMDRCSHGDDVIKKSLEKLPQMKGPQGLVKITSTAVLSNLSIIHDLCDRMFKNNDLHERYMGARKNKNERQGE